LQLDISNHDRFLLLRFFKQYRWGIFYIAVVSTVVILFGSPLFRTLGFEYSALTALALSLLLPLIAAERSAVEGSLTSRALWLGLGREIGFYVAVPLLLSVVSLVWIPNCALVDGLMFYISVVVPTATVGTLLGVAIGIHAKRKRQRIVWLVIVWVATLAIGFIPGYFSAQIFSFGWQYGYFPGFVWDEAMELRHGYWPSRIEQVSELILFLSLTRSVRRMRSVRIAQVASLLVLVFIVGSRIRIDAPAADERGYSAENGSTRPLSYTIEIGPVRVHFPGNMLTAEQLQELRYDVAKDMREIRSYYHLPPSNRQIDVYLYASTKELEEYVGTRNASISKPWQSTLHIARENLGSLKHELTHVVLAEYGNLPFGVSYSTGLTEGAAEAASPEYDGIRSIHELAASILAMKFAGGITDVISFTGFASNASSKSYVLAGSFSSYLIERFGPTTFLRTYTSLHYEQQCGASLEALEEDWKNYLKQFSPVLTPNDSLRLRYYFDRRSIIAEPCLRRIGKLMRNARTSFDKHDFVEADSLFASVVAESGRLDALRGRIYSLIRLGRFRDALRVLDTTHAGPSDLKMAALHLVRVDLLFLAGESIDSASVEWQMGATLGLNREQILLAGIRLYCFARTKDTDRARIALADFYQNEAHPHSHTFVTAIEGNPDDQLFACAKDYLLSRLKREQGELRNELTYLTPIDGFIRSRVDHSRDDWTSIFFRSIEERYNELVDIFGRPE
jgi:hypothetical protein